MQIDSVKLTDLKEAERNIRKHSETQIEAFTKSIEQFGQIRPIVTDEEYVIIAGHGLYETLVSMERETANILVMKGLSEAQKRKLMLADNKVYDLGMNDHEALMETIEEIKFDLGGDLDIPGFDEDVLEELFGSMDEVEESLTEYGVVGEERATELKEERERVTSGMMGKPQEMVLNEKAVQVEPATETEVARPFTVCVNCGEKNWL